MSPRLPLAVVVGIAALFTWGGVATAQAGVGGVWMAGPGCGGRYEWFQHPEEFPYFCDGTAGVEGAHWRGWGAATATASATFNEAALNSHNSVATAPRRRSAVTITASRIKLCGGRRAYTRIVITYRRKVNGVKTLEAAGLLPKCAAGGQRRASGVATGPPTGPAS